MFLQNIGNGRYNNLKEVEYIQYRLVRGKPELYYVECYFINGNVATVAAVSSVKDAIMVVNELATRYDDDNYHGCYVFDNTKKEFVSVCG